MITHGNHSDFILKVRKHLFSEIVSDVVFGTWPMVFSSVLDICFLQWRNPLQVFCESVVNRTTIAGKRNVWSAHWFRWGSKTRDETKSYVTYGESKPKSETSTYTLNYLSLHILVSVKPMLICRDDRFLHSLSVNVVPNCNSHKTGDNEYLFWL